MWGTVHSDLGSVVIVRFQRFVLPGGGEGRLVGEAQSDDGRFGLSLNGGNAQNDEEKNAIGEAAARTTGDLALDLLGGGLAGDVARLS